MPYVKNAFVAKVLEMICLLGHTQFVFFSIGFFVFAFLVIYIYFLETESSGFF